MIQNSRTLVVCLGVVSLLPHFCLSFDSFVCGNVNKMHLNFIVSRFDTYLSTIEIKTRRPLYTYFRFIDKQSIFRDIFVLDKTGNELGPMTLNAFIMCSVNFIFTVKKGNAHHPIDFAFVLCCFDIAHANISFLRLMTKGAKLINNKISGDFAILLDNVFRGITVPR